jgi:type I restriction enzyme S subunit
LEIQREIVAILTKMETLEAELEAELEARRAQYAYYRDQLLTFPEGGVRWIPMGEIVDIARTRVPSQRLDNTNYVGVDNLLPDLGGRVDSTYAANSSGAIEFHTGDLLIGNIRPYLKKAWLADRSGGASPDVLVLSLNEVGRRSVLSDFLYYVVASEKFFHYSMKHAKGAKMPRGDKAATLQFKIPMPSLDEQMQIIEVLDRFRELTSGLTGGLPAELAARRKQYEYYRDRLLTFDELVA